MPIKYKSASQINNPKLAYQKLLIKIVVNKETGCWEWSGSKSYYGYGVFYFEKRSWSVHRLMYEYANGYIEQDKSATHKTEKCVLHKCDNPCCCNPSHLFIGTRADNVRDMADKVRGNSEYRTSAGYGSYPTGTVHVHFKGEIHAVRELAKELNMNLSTLMRRFRSGWHEDEITSRPRPGYIRDRLNQQKYQFYVGKEAAEEARNKLESRRAAQ